MKGVAHTVPESVSLSVGPYEVHVLRDGVYTAPISHLAHARGEAERDAAIARWGKPDFAVDVNCYALHGPGGLVLIDAGVGDAWGPDYGNAPLALRDAGFTPEQVDVVLLTHIHGDHALGLFDGEAARFPNARVLVPQGDIAHYGDAAIMAATPENKRSSFKTVARLNAAYGDRIGTVGMGPVLPGIDAIALPGHSPGHTGYRVHDDRRSLFMWGDVVHIEGLQLPDPDVCLNYDFDAAQALHSRRVALESAAREGWYVAGSHVSGIHRIERLDDGFVFVRENA